MGKELKITLRDGGRISLGGGVRVGMAGLCSGITDGSIVSVNENNYESLVGRGPLLLQLRDFFAAYGERAVVCGVDQTGATPGSGTTPTLTGTGLATAALVDDTLATLDREIEIEVIRVVNEVGRPGSTFAKLTINGQVICEEFKLAITNGATPYKSRIYLEQITDRTPLVAATGVGPAIEFSESAVTPEDSFIVGDKWGFTLTGIQATTAKTLDALEALSKWRDTYGLQVSESHGAIIGLATPLDADSWDEVNGIGQDRYDFTVDNEQRFCLFVISANETESGETTKQQSVDRYCADLDTLIAGEVTRDEKPWTAPVFTWAKYDDGEGNLDSRPLIGLELAFIAREGVHAERSPAWHKDENKLKRMIEPWFSGLDSATANGMVKQIRDSRGTTIEHAPGAGYFFDDTPLPSPSSSKLVNLTDLHGVALAATVTHLRNTKFKNAPGVDGAALADQQADINEPLRTLVDNGVFNICKFVIGEVTDWGPPVIISGKIILDLKPGRGAFEYDLIVTRGGN